MVAKDSAKPQLIRRINRETVLYYLRQERQLSRAGLAELTRLSKPSISKLVDELIQEGCIREIGIGESKGGRKPIMLEINPTRFSILGIVFEGTKMSLAVCDLNGAIIAEASQFIDSREVRESSLAVLETTVDRLLKEACIDKDTLLGIGVGIPGIVSHSRGLVSFSPSTGWQDRPIQEELEQIFGLPVIVENDVNLMALGEYRQGAGAGVENTIYFHVGTGIGAGVIINGRLYRGATGAAGEIGHYPIGNPKNRLLPESGIFESNYSLPALTARVKAEFDEGVGNSVDEWGSVIELLAKERATNPRMKEILEEACRSWLYGIAGVVCVLNPEAVILGGGLGHLGDWGLEFFQTSLGIITPVKPEVRYATLGDKAGVIGAVCQVMENDRSLTGGKHKYTKGGK